MTEVQTGPFSVCPPIAAYVGGNQFGPAIPWCTGVSGKERDRLPVVQELCEQQTKTDVNARDHRGRTALHLAAMCNNSNAIRVLCSDSGADTESCDASGNTPLLLAVRLGNQAAVKALVTQGADLEVTDQEGSTPLMWACSANGAPEVVEELLKSHEGKISHAGARSD